MEFSAFLILAVWTTSITYLTSGKGELQTTNCFLSIFILQRVLSYFPSIFIIYLFFYIHIYIYIFFFFLLVRNSWCTELITFRYDKAKNLSMNSTKTRLWIQPRCFIIRAISEICKSLLLQNMLRTATVKIASSNTISILMLSSYWTGNRYHQKHFVVDNLHRRKIGSSLPTWAK